jgi:hypothetical protein
MITTRKRKPRPQLVAWTDHYVVRGGRTVGRDAWVLLPGKTSPELVEVTLPAVAA